MISEEVLKEIENLGSLAMKPEEIGVVVQIPPIEFKRELLDPESDVYQAYYRGVYRREAELRQVIFEQALSGSTPAQALALKYFVDLKLELQKI